MLQCSFTIFLYAAQERCPYNLNWRVASPVALVMDAVATMRVVERIPSQDRHCRILRATTPDASGVSLVINQEQHVLNQPTITRELKKEGDFNVVAHNGWRYYDAFLTLSSQAFKSSSDGLSSTIEIVFGAVVAMSLRRLPVILPRLSRKN